MKELEITFLLRNNRLKERRIKLGLTAQQLAEKAGINACSYSKFEAMNPKVQLLNRSNWKGRKKGDWTDSVKKLAQFHDVDPTELFPNVVFETSFNRLSKKIDAEEMPLLSGNCDQLLSEKCDSQNPEEILSAKERVGLLRKNVFPDLTNQEQRVLELRYQDDLNKTETARAFGKSKERIKQIEENALRKLRSPRFRYKAENRSKNAK